MDYRTRAQWGATYDVSQRAIMTGLPVATVYIHHTVTTPTSDPNADMRGIEAIDIQRFGVPSYSWVIHPSGTVLEGMGIHRGAHTINNANQSQNDISFGISHIGNYENDQPTQAQLQATADLIHYINDHGWLQGNWQLLGHRDVYATACPGANLYPRLADIRNLYDNPAPVYPKGVLVTAEWFLHPQSGSGADNHFVYGNPGDTPVVGDWNGDGIDTVGVFRGGQWYLRNSNSPGAANISFQFGDVGDIPIVGDWNGDGIDGVGVVRGNIFYLRNSLTTGAAEVTFTFGNPAYDIPITGKWKAGQTKDSVGVKRGNVFYLRNADTGAADITFTYGDNLDGIIMADFNGDGVDTPCLKRGIQYFVRNSNTSGAADYAFQYGNPDDVPLHGRWTNTVHNDGFGLGR